MRGDRGIGSLYCSARIALHSDTHWHHKMIPGLDSKGREGLAEDSITYKLNNRNVQIQLNIGKQNYSMNLVDSRCLGSDRVVSDIG